MSWYKKKPNQKTSHFPFTSQNQCISSGESKPKSLFEAGFLWGLFARFRRPWMLDVQCFLDLIYCQLNLVLLKFWLFLHLTSLFCGCLGITVVIYLWEPVNWGFTLECQQVKWAVWCCETEFLPNFFFSCFSQTSPDFKAPSPSLAPSLSSHFNPLQQRPFSSKAGTPPPSSRKKNCQPKLFSPSSSLCWVAITVLTGSRN